jgi:hypothetical protein
MNAPNQPDFKLSELCSVTVEYGRDTGYVVEKYIIPKQDLDAFVEATVRLHHDPGINPHNKHITGPIRRISTDSFSVVGPFWWTTPDLQSTGKSGARIIRPHTECGEQVWIDPVYKQKLLQDEGDLEL